MAKRFKELMKALFTEWGLSLEPPKGPARSLDVVLKLEDADKSITVGKLSVADSRFVFVYSEAFKESDLPPLPGFPDKEERYDSDVLFPFFQVRLPPKSRDDVARVMEERKVTDADVFDILKVLGRKAMTSPYEFETSPSHPAYAAQKD